MHLEEFAEGNSFLHRVDPRVKFITLMPYILVIAVMQGLKGPFAGLVIAVLLASLSRLNLRKLINRLSVVNAFILLLWIFIPFTYPGERILALGPLNATKEGILYVLSISLKTNTIVLATIAILGTSEVFSLAHALVHLRFPDKLVRLFFFFYRYISVLHEEYSKLRRAMKIRCFHPATNIHTYRTYANLVGMLLVMSYERSQRVYMAMLCRGFDGRFPVAIHFYLRRSDVIFGVLMMVITFLLILMML